MSYWQYYDSKFGWDTPAGLMEPDIKEVIKLFVHAGYELEQAKELVKSGFIYIPEANIVIDRYYGGALSSSNFKNRFPLEQTKEILDKEACSQVWVKNAKSMEDLEAIVRDAKESVRGEILFRGQNENYSLNRSVINPNYYVPEFGEVSLVPSLWRKMLDHTPYYFREFENLKLFEWSRILYNQFDLNEMEARQKILAEQGEYLFTMSDMEDCSDPVLREFGKFRLDLSMNLDWALATTLSTMLQHYGLYSPVLDLSSSLDVALFFATHKYTKLESGSKYDFIGTNNGKAVLYLIREDRKEMERHDRDCFAIKNFEPLRPIKQDCVVCRSGAYAVNLAADFLEGIIVLDFNLSETEVRLSQADLFPTEKEDVFLKALKSSKKVESKVTEFIS